MQACRPIFHGQGFDCSIGLIVLNPCGLAVALLFLALYKGAPFKWQDAWIGITLGPLMEEAVFRGYLFGLVELGLRKRVPHPGWITGIAIAAVFALCHLSEGRNHGSPDRRHLRDGRRLRLAQDQVEFDDLAISGALSVQRHHFRRSRAARVSHLVYVHVRPVAGNSVQPELLRRIDKRHRMSGENCVPI